MRARGLLISAVALAALAGVVYWSNHRKPAEAKSDADAAPKILSITQDLMRQVELKKKDGTATVLRRSDSAKWDITAPKPLRADQDAVNSLVGTFANLTAERLIEEKAADLAGYGLATPSLEAIITKKDNQTLKLLLGDDTPTGSAVFAKLSSDPKVFTVSTFIKTSLDKSGNDLRDKRLMTFDAEKYSRVELKAKKQVMEFGKNNQNEWQILIPNPMRADGFQVEELVRKLRDAKMDTAVSDEASKKAAAAFSSGTLAGIARVTDAGGSQQIEVRKNKDDYYAKSSVVEGVHKVTSELGQGVDKSVDDFRNKKLFDFGFTDPTRVEYHAGAVSRVFVKAGEKWTSASKQMDPTSVQALIDKLRDLAATKFADKGFTTSTFELSVTSKRAEKVSFSKSDNGYIGQRESENALYEIDAKTADDLQKAVTDVKEAPAPKK